MSGHDVILPPRLQSLKGATAALIRAFGGQEAAARETGRGQSQINRYQNVNTEEFAPVHVVAALEAATQGMPGAPHVTRWLARELGFALVPLPAVDDSTTWGRQASAVMRETGASINALADALDDEEFTPAEAKAVLPKFDSAVDVLCALREAVKRRAEGQF